MNLLCLTMISSCFSHLRNMLNVEASEDERLDAGIIEEVKEEYVSMREP